MIQCFQLFRHLSILARSSETTILELHTTKLENPREKHTTYHSTHIFMPQNQDHNLTPLSLSITISTTPTPYALLDLHFSPHDPSLLAVAGSTGCLQLFRLSSATSPTPSLDPLATYQYFDPAILALSLAWHPVDAHKLGVTASDGGVYVVSTDVEGDEARGTGKQVLEHELEAWTSIFSHDGSALYSGGDDASLRSSTLEVSEEQQQDDEFTPIQWQDRRSHQAGVTAILPLASEENILITGSYDDNIRVLHAPLVGRKQILAEENLEAGVWRLKLLHQDSQARS